MEIRKSVNRIFRGFRRNSHPRSFFTAAVKYLYSCSCNESFNKQKLGKLFLSLPHVSDVAHDSASHEVFCDRSRKVVADIVTNVAFTMISQEKSTRKQVSLWEFETTIESRYSGISFIRTVSVGKKF